MNREGFAVVRLFREASRRKVFRTAALYVVGAWLALQVADVLFPGFGIPNEAIQALVWAAVLGFPVALVFGWLFEVGPGGVRRTLPAGADSTAPQPLGRRDYLVLAAFAMVASVLVYRAAQEVRRAPAEGPTLTAETAPTDRRARLENSIAVLPFANISNDPDNEYFCDGISEEILNTLAGFRELNVIGRTSSFAFRDSDVGVDRISAVLGVRHVLQGSVRKAGNQLRIAAQLLDEDGRQVWAQTFDRELANVFDIQSEIASAVARMVASQIASSTAARQHPDLAAYDHYLAGRAMLHRREAGRAREELQRAIDIDPLFAEAHAEWAIARVMGEPSTQDVEAGRQAIDRALELQPTLLRAHVAKGLLLLQASPPDPAGAESILRRALAQDPSMSDALLWLQNSLMEQGRSDEAFEVLQRAARIDPFHPSIASNLFNALVQRGESDEALRLLKRQLEQPKPTVGAFVALRDTYQLAGRLVELNAVAKEQALRVGVQHYSLAISYALLGDSRAAGYWIDRHVRDFPDFMFTRYFQSIPPHWRGLHEEALQRFDESLDASKIDIAKEHAYVRSWYGQLLARAGRHAAAIDVLEGAVHRDGLLGTTGQEIDAQWAPLLALAWSYQKTGADAEAEKVLTGLWLQCREERADTDSRHSLFLHFCAEVALLRGEVDEALGMLERAVTVGWRDYYLQQDNVYWASLEDDVRYRAIMAQVKADVDQQRAEVERIDAKEDFVAKLDAAMAARRAAGG